MEVPDYTMVGSLSLKLLWVPITSSSPFSCFLFCMIYKNKVVNEVKYLIRQPLINMKPNPTQNTDTVKLNIYELLFQ